jgi:MFS transporter, YNFM family, putative membrane transport protein
MGMNVSANSIGDITSGITVTALTDWFSWQIALGTVSFLSLINLVWKILPASTHFSA